MILSVDRFRPPAMMMRPLVLALELLRRDRELLRPALAPELHPRTMAAAVRALGSGIESTIRLSPMIR